MTKTLGDVFANAVTLRKKPVQLASANDDTELDTDFSEWAPLDARIKAQKDFEDAAKRLQTHPGNKTLHAVPQRSRSRL